VYSTEVLCKLSFYAFLIFSCIYRFLIMPPKRVGGLESYLQANPSALKFKPKNPRVRKPKPKQAKPKTRVVVMSSQSQAPKLSFPGPRQPNAVERVLAADGLALKAISPSAAARRNMILTMSDHFECALIQSLFYPQQPFPLPGIHISGIPNITAIGDIGPELPLSRPSGVSPGPAWTGIGRYIEARGTTLNQTAGEGTCEVARYSRYSGKSIATVETSTDALGNAEVWFFHDPSDLVDPVKIIKPAVGGNYLGITSVQDLAWTSNPYVFPQQYVSENGDHPCTLVETNNLYYMGGCVLEVSTNNPNAFLSTSYQTRTGDNTPDRFQHDLPNLWAGVEPVAPLSLSDTVMACNGCISVYTGASWHVGLAPANTNGWPSPDDHAYHLSSAFRRCWAMGAPWIRCVARTTSNGVPVPGAVQFNVTFNCWAATAPSLMVTAASQPFETVPLQSPSWLRTLKTRGCVYDRDTKKNAYSDMMREMVSRLRDNVTGETQVQRTFLANPKAAVKTILASPQAERPSKTTSWVDNVGHFLEQGVDFGFKYAPTIANLASMIGSLF
jgi:hypothetical protein